MEKRRHHRSHPRPATPLPTFRGKQLVALRGGPTDPKTDLSVPPGLPGHLVLLVLADLGDGKGGTKEFKAGDCALRRSSFARWGCVTCPGSFPSLGLLPVGTEGGGLQGCPGGAEWGMGTREWPDLSFLLSPLQRPDTLHALHLDSASAPSTPGPLST